MTKIKCFVSNWFARQDMIYELVALVTNRKSIR